MRVAFVFTAFLAVVGICVMQMDRTNSVVRSQGQLPVYVLGEIPVAAIGDYVIVNDVLAIGGKRTGTS